MPAPLFLINPSLTQGERPLPISTTGAAISFVFLSDTRQLFCLHATFCFHPEKVEFPATSTAQRPNNANEIEADGSERLLTEFNNSLTEEQRFSY
jgi:hypothetical protein